MPIQYVENYAFDYFEFMLFLGCMMLLGSEGWKMV